MVSLDYDPPVNWNELYDVGWYHSDREKLRQNYTRQALLKEAEKAAALGCDLLYLDPGWEVVEGTTLWDEERLGTVVDLIATLKEDYGLDLAYRTILRCHTEHWPERYMVKHPDRPVEEVTFYDGVRGWELCLCNPELWQEKLERILEISRHGVRFMMFDEMALARPCNTELPRQLLSESFRYMCTRRQCSRVYQLQWIPSILLSCLYTH